MMAKHLIYINLSYMQFKINFIYILDGGAGPDNFATKCLILRVGQCKWMDTRFLFEKLLAAYVSR